MAKPLIDWNSDDSHVLINPLLPETTRNSLIEAVSPHHSLQGHIWLSSSGTESFPKMIALSKKAMLISAEAVNAHLQAKSHHSWLNVLPLFHAGGLGPHARALLSDCSIYDFSDKKWDPITYVKLLEDLKTSFSSLTPTHIYDIVNLQLSSPKVLKAIIVGGASLSETLHEKAIDLGWPLLKSYGMTEVGSQIATASNSLSDSFLTILKHINLRFDTEGFIEIKSDALLSGFVHGDDPNKRFIDPKVEGWYKTQDKGGIVNNSLQIYGRGTNFIKIGGENVNFSELEKIWENIKFFHKFHEDAVIIDLPDDRLGRNVCLAVASSKENCDLNALLKDFHKQVLPIAKIRSVFYVDKLPRSELYKLKKEELRKMIQNTL
ncbi:MAG: AMP-binding protein [Parachlamydiaceae bacterium]|nr:AMP-binding protein [Parachlamydiaceae bacterium]